MNQKLVKKFLAGDYLALSKLITLVESKKNEHYQEAFEIFKTLRNERKEQKSKIIGISGPPGVGKSTFINKFISTLTKNKASIKIAILSVDPSSELSGGSILGDKSRMQDITVLDNVFIRPSPSETFLGGVAPKTYEVVRICEMFGFDYIVLETVGIGQSENLVNSICDYFTLLVQPVSGDDLQGMKKGVLENANTIIVNKADGPLLETAKKLKNDYQHSLKHHQQIILGSSLNEKSSVEYIQLLEDFFSKFTTQNRAEKFDFWFEQRVQEQVWLNIMSNKNLKKEYESILESVRRDQYSLWEGVEFFKEQINLKN